MATMLTARTEPQGGNAILNHFSPTVEKIDDLQILGEYLDDVAVRALQAHKDGTARSLEDVIKSVNERMGWRDEEDIFEQ